MEEKKSNEEPVSIMDNYKFPSCDYSRNIIMNSEEPINQSIFNTFSKKREKKVTFEDNVTIINIQSHKKSNRNKFTNNLKAKIEEDFKEEEKNQKACANCTIF